MGRVHNSGRGRAEEGMRGERRGRGGEVRKREGTSLVAGWRERLEFLFFLRRGVGMVARGMRIGWRRVRERRRRRRERSKVLQLKAGERRLVVARLLRERRGSAHYIARSGWTR